MNASILKSSNTHDVGYGKINATVTVPIIVALLLKAMARLWRMAVNPMLRIFIVSGAIAEGHPKAQELRHAMGVPSIHDSMTPAQKAVLFEAELSRMRVSRSDNGEEIYISEFNSVRTVKGARKTEEIA